MGIEEFLLDEAYKKNFKKGYQQGYEEVVNEIALKMRKSGLDTILIAQVTGLTIARINELN